MFLGACFLCACFLCACFCVHSKINSQPFKTNRLLHGYSGMFMYWIWKECLGVEPGVMVKEERLGLESEGVVKEEVAKPQDVVSHARLDRTKALAKHALKHFTDMECLDMTPSTSSNVDYFIWIHSQVKYIPLPLFFVLTTFSSMLSV